MATKQMLVKITEESIRELVSVFKQNPHLFYTESDLHYYLYAKILEKLPMKEWMCKTTEGQTSLLLHKEYPTKNRYSRKLLKKGLEKGSRGHFDLVIWNPEQVEKRYIRTCSGNFSDEQCTFIAVEFDLKGGNATLDAFHHFKWDLLKLRDEKNEVEHGYLLLFVRNWIWKDKFLEKARSEVAKEKEVVVLYAEEDKNQRRIETLSFKQFEHGCSHK